MNLAWSPFNAGLVSSGGLSINQDGTLLFASDFDSATTEFSVMKVGKKGALTLHRVRRSQLGRMEVCSR